MSPLDGPHDRTISPATDMCAALAALAGAPRSGALGTGALFTKHGFSPDDAAADFALTHAGVPATPRPGSEPAVLYPQPSGPDLLIGLYGDETRIRDWLPGLAGRRMPEAARALRPVPPVEVRATHRPVTGTGLGALPIPRVTPRDAGAYVTMGFVMAGRPGADLTLSAHRMLVLGAHTLGISMLSGRHLRRMAKTAWEAGRPLPVSVNIGVPPAAAIASATGTAHLPDRFDKLSLAGALAQAPLHVGTPRIGAPFLAQSGFVLHADLCPETCAETRGHRSLGATMPEFLGYDGQAGAPLHILHVRRIEQRAAAPFQATIGPGREQSAILGLGGALALALALGAEPTAASVVDLRFSHAGGGMLLLMVALDTPDPAGFEALARRMIAICPFVKTVLFLDDDVDLSSEEHVLWAMTTRASLARDTHPLDGFAPLRMDPSQGPNWVRGDGPARCYVDATVPLSCAPAARRSFVRAARPGG